MNQLHPVRVITVRYGAYNPAVLADLQTIATAYGFEATNPDIDEVLGSLAANYLIEFGKGGQYQIENAVLARTLFDALNAAAYIDRIATDIAGVDISAIADLLADAEVLEDLQTIASA